jgi:NAD dependent epimerase/dehydratase family enzyme
VAPVPVNNKTLTLQLARKMRGRFFIPIHIPAFVLKLMMGERSIEVLKSTTVSSIKIKDQGFVFLYPSIESALAELFNTTDQHE